MVTCTEPEEFIAEIILFWMFAADMLLRAAGAGAGGFALPHPAKAAIARKPLADAVAVSSRLLSLVTRTGVCFDRTYLVPCCAMRLSVPEYLVDI
jgi:hypothetical protein